MLLEKKLQFGLTWRRSVVLGTPLILTILLLFHPSPYDDVVGELMPIAGWWITLHTILFVLVPLMGAAVWMLTAGLEGVDPVRPLTPSACGDARMLA